MTRWQPTLLSGTVLFLLVGVRISQAQPTCRLDQEVHFAKSLCTPEFHPVARIVLARLLARFDLPQELWYRAALELDTLPFNEVATIVPLGPRCRRLLRVMQELAGRMLHRVEPSYDLDLRRRFVVRGVLPFLEICRFVEREGGVGPVWLAWMGKIRPKVIEAGLQAMVEARGLVERHFHLRLFWERVEHQVCELKVARVLLPASDPVRRHRLDCAIAQLEDVLLGFGPVTLLGLRQVLLLARCYEEKGDLKEVLDLVKSVQEEARELVQDPELVIPPKAKVEIMDIMARAAGEAMRLQVEKRRKPGEAIRHALDLFRRLQKMGPYPTGRGGFQAIYWYTKALARKGLAAQALPLINKLPPTCHPDSILTRPLLRTLVEHTSSR